MNEKIGNSVFLGFDFGLKHIGVAVGQSITSTASPLQVINVTTKSELRKIIGLLLLKWQPAALIVGMPLNMDGSEEFLTRVTKLFIIGLRKITNIPIYEVDERLTTKSAREELFNLGGYKALQKEGIDSFAAKIILESWLRDNLRC